MSYQSRLFDICLAVQGLFLGGICFDRNWFWCALMCGCGGLVGLVLVMYPVPAAASPSSGEEGK